MQSPAFRSCKSLYNISRFLRKRRPFAFTQTILAVASANRIIPSIASVIQCVIVIERGDIDVGDTGNKKGVKKQTLTYTNYEKDPEHGK